MLDQQHGNILFQCDKCDEVLEAHTSNFAAARNMFMRAGWKAVKVRDDWKHYCPHCSH